MANNRTYSMVKPHAVADGHIGGILKMIEEAGSIFGELAVKALNNKIKNKEKGCIKMVTRTKLTVRESTCPPKAEQR